MSFWDTVSVIASKASQVLSTLGGEVDENALHEVQVVDRAEQTNVAQTGTLDAENAQMQKV